MQACALVPFGGGPMASDKAGKCADLCTFTAIMEAGSGW